MNGNNIKFIFMTCYFKKQRLVFNYILFLLIVTGNIQACSSDKKMEKDMQLSDVNKGLMLELKKYQKIIDDSKRNAGGDLNSQFWYKKGKCEVSLKMFDDGLISYSKSIEAANDSHLPDQLWKSLSMAEKIYTLQELRKFDEANKLLLEYKEYIKNYNLANREKSLEMLTRLENRANKLNQ